MFLSESERRKQGVWIQDCRSWIQDARIQDGRIWDIHHHQVEWEWMSLSHTELVWVRVKMELECFWVNLREDNKMSVSKMAVSESKMQEFKMAAIIKLSQNEWVRFFVQNSWIQDGRIQGGCHHEVESEWMSLSHLLNLKESVGEVYFCANSGNQSWQVWVS